MENLAQEEDRKIQNLEKLNALNKQLEEKKKMMEELDKKLEDKNEILRAKKKELNEADRLLQLSRKKLEESSTETYFDKRQLSTRYSLQSPLDDDKVLNFNDIKWEEKNFITGSLGLWSGMISANAVEVNGIVCIGLADESSTHLGFLHIPPNPFKFASLAISPGVTNFGIAACKGNWLVIGGQKINYNIGTKTYSNLVMSCLDQEKWESAYPPMKQASASPGVVNYKDRIVVVHGEGSNGGIEVLDVNSVNPVWVEIQSPFPVWNTPSATMLGSTLVVWVGALYCTSLDHTTEDVLNGTPLGIYSNPPPPIENITLCYNMVQFLTLRGQLVAVDYNNREGHGQRMYAYRSATREWVNIDNQKQFQFAFTVNGTSIAVIPIRHKFETGNFGLV